MKDVKSGEEGDGFSFKGGNGSRVELRSDALEGGIKKVKSFNKADKKWWLLGGLIVVLLLVVTGTVWLMPGRRVEVEGEQGKSNWAFLPRADEKNKENKGESVLSGVRCEGADRRPIGVMLSSDAITRPVSGFSEADMVWELPVLVNDVTRFMAVYQCGRPEEIGSVRSARHDYLFLAEGIDAILGHWGGSYHALNRIAVGEFDTINALGNPFGAFFRVGSLPAPYNGFTNYDNLWKALQGLGYRSETTFEGYKFKDDTDPDDRPGGGKLSIGWPGTYRVDYEYNRETNRYERFWGGVKQVDGFDKSQVAPSAVLIMRGQNMLAEGEGGYNDVEVEGEGALEVYQDGKVIKGSWRKNELYKQDPVHFLDEKGEEVALTRGQIWVMVVEPEIAVTWEEKAMPSPSSSVVPEPSAGL